MIPVIVNGEQKAMGTLQIMDSLTYSFYAYNRDLGMSHDKLIFCGVGDDAMRSRYEEKQGELK